MRTVLLIFAVALAACSKETQELTATQAPNDVSRLAPLPSGEIEGTLELAPDMAANVKAGDTIYLMARSAGTGGIVAVQKLAAPASFPLPFKLTGDNVMMPGASLAGQIKLSARVDKDGDAMSKNPGDVVGEIEQAVTVPSKDVTLVLRSVL